MTVIRCLTAVLLAVALATGISSTASASAVLDAARADVERARLDAGQREAAKEYLAAAERAERDADALSARLVALRAETAGQPARVEELEVRLETDREQALLTWSQRLPKDADGETLERLLEQQRRVVEQVQAQIDAVGADLALVLSRPAEVAGDVATLRRHLEEMSVAVAGAENEPAVLLESRRLQRAAELRRVQAELDLRVAEQDSAALRQRQLELTLRELRHRLGLEHRRVEVLQQRIANLWRTELATLIQKLAAREQELAGAAPVVSLAATENTALGNELIENHQQLARDRRELASTEEERDYVTGALRDSRTRLDLGGANERVGRWLWSERRRLEPPARLRQQLETARITLADLRLRLVTLNDQQQQLSDIPGAVRALREASEAGADDEQSDVGAEELLPPLLRERVELLALLRPVLDRRIAALQQSEGALDDRLQATEALQNLLDRHLLWLPSHGAVNAEWLARVPEGLSDLVKPSRFATTFELVVRKVGENPALWFSTIVLLLAAILLRIRAPARIDAYASSVDELTPTYRGTGSAFVWTVVGALPGPAAVGLAGLLLQQLGSPGRFSDSLGRACVALVMPLLAVQLMRWTVLDRGLADVHFGWQKTRRKVLQRWLPIAAAVVLPMYFVTVLAFARRSDLAIDVQARLAVVVGAIALAWTFWRLLDTGRLWALRKAGAEPSTMRLLLRGLLPMLPLANAALALSGYIYSSGVLLQSLLDSIGLVVGVTIALGMLARWFVVGEQRLALRQLEASRAAVDAPAPDSADGVAPPRAEITVQEVGAQTGSLLRALRVSLLTLGLIWVWVDVLPAIYRLDEVAVWHFTEAGLDGVNIKQPVTLAAMLLGIFALVVTVVGSRNLPGLIEISLLSRAGVDAASRYVVTSLLRYAIVIGGTLVGFSLLGMRWSQLQWMAAALTVGLGFGLQEIFANFVSGIILLFERPFRVGDVITVGDMTGRVTRIRTRATTILDFDNKEIVMPNKMFITGHLTNWALSDTTTRVTIKVGVAYGNDPEGVRKLLLQAAAEDKRVVNEPAPSCWFLAFGKSSLDFELRVFVGTLGDRLEVQHSLNTRINQLLTDQGIEIAFAAGSARS